MFCTLRSATLAFAVTVASSILVVTPILTYAAPVTISGKVYYSSAPMESIQIDLVDTASRVILTSSKTDENGRYSFAGVGEGTYQVVAKAPSPKFNDGIESARITASSRDATVDVYLTKPIALLNPPLSSAPGAVLPSAFPTFSWEAAPAEASRWVIGLRPLDPPGPTIAVSVSSPDWTPVLPLCPGFYAWIVTGFDNGGRRVGVSSDSSVLFPGGKGVPRLEQPSCRALLTEMETPLSWHNPEGTTQYHLQVAPYGNDGPGMNLIRAAEESFMLSRPVFGQGNYLLLPDMSYQWRIRTSTSSTALGERDAGWGPWSDWWVFRSPRLQSNTASPSVPPSGTTSSSMTPTLTWTDSTGTNFYYEVQLSKDPSFTTDAARAVASVYQNLVHGAQSAPPNSYVVPSSAPLAPNTTYYWRVRPRIQGDGRPLAWSKLGVLCTAPASCPDIRIPTAGSNDTGALVFTPTFGSEGIAFVSRRITNAPGGFGMAQLLRTADRGASWVEIGDGRYKAVEPLTFSTTFASDRILFAGGVDPTADVRTSLATFALLRSNDAGATWTKVETLPLPVTSIALSPMFATDGVRITTWNGTANITSAGFSQGNRAYIPTLNNDILGGPGFFSWAMLSPDYANDGTIYVRYGSVFDPETSTSTFDRLLVSRDRAMTWARASLPTNGNDAAFTPSPNFAADHTLFFSSDLGLYSSTDNATSWSRLGDGCNGPPAISPKFATNGVIYCGSGTRARLSSDGGRTWRTPSYWPDNSGAYAFTPDGTQLWVVLRDGMVLATPAP